MRLHREIGYLTGKPPTAETSGGRVLGEYFATNGIFNLTSYSLLVRAIRIFLPFGKISRVQFQYCNLHPISIRPLEMTWPEEEE
jgi:hypothetical protein